MFTENSEEVKRLIFKLEDKLIGKSFKSTLVECSTFLYSFEYEFQLRFI